MVALLTVEKRRLLAANGRVTTSDFREAWERCWGVMVLERAWAHATVRRRGSRRMMIATRGEYRDAFLDTSTAFSFATTRLRDAADRMGLPLAPEQVGRALLAAIAYVQGEDEHEAARESAAARVFRTAA